MIDSQRSQVSDTFISVFNLPSHHIEYIQILYRLEKGIKNSFIFINIFKM